MSSALRDLKRETLDLHEAAERHVRILDQDATEATYARFLGRMLGFHGPMEERFAGHAGLAAAGFDAAARRKQALLRADLEALAVDHARLPWCTDLPEIGDLPRAVGAAYVLEGSTLGGPFIVSRMRARLGHLIGRATAFLEGYRERTGAMWRGYGALAERALAGDDALRAAIAAARSTFAKLVAWLDEPAVDPPHPFRGLRPRQVTL